MTDQTNPVTFQANQDGAPTQAPAQEPGTPSVEVTQGTTPDQPKWITQEEAQKIAEAAAEAAFRRAQGLNDKTASRINSQMAEMLKSYKALTGQEPDANIQARARTQAEQMVRSQPEGNNGGQAVEDVNRKAAELYRTSGITLEEDDPEARTVDQSSPEKFLSSLQAAIDAKRTRTSNNKPQTNPIGSAPILGNRGGPSNPIANINDPAELLRIGLGGKR